MWFYSPVSTMYILGSKTMVKCGQQSFFFLTFVSAGIGDDDLDDVYWSCDEEMKPESWEEMLESRAGACCGSVELRYRWRG